MTHGTLFALSLLLLFCFLPPAAASSLDCNVAYSKCQLDARKKGPKTPCDKAMECEALALCEFNYCVCRRAGSGHLGINDEIDPALKAEAMTVCGTTHGRTGKCRDIARKCSDFRAAQHQAAQHHGGNSSHGSSSHGHKPKPEKPEQDRCNPNFDPNNLKGPDDRPCIR